MQYIDEYPALLNINEDYVYSLGSRINHDCTYVSLNWKKETEKNIKTVREEMEEKLQLGI